MTRFQEELAPLRNLVNARLTFMVNIPLRDIVDILFATALPPQAAFGVPERGGLQPPRFPFRPTPIPRD